MNHRDSHTKAVPRFRNTLAERKKKRMAKDTDQVDAPVEETPVEIETVIDTPVTLDTYSAPTTEVEPRPACNGCDIKDGYCQGCGKFEPEVPAED